VIGIIDTIDGAGRSAGAILGAVRVSRSLRRTDLNLLPVLAALLEYRHVTRAAEAVGIGQPSMSAALARLRRLFDDPLLVRRGRTLELTPLGQALVDPLNDALGGLDRLLRVTAQFDPAHDQRSFTVAASDYVSLILLRPLLEELYRDAPGLSVTVVPVTTGATGTLAALEGGQIDLAIMPARVADNESPNSHRRSRSLFRDRYIPAVWTHNREVGDVLDRESLHRLPYACYRSEGGGKAYVDLQLYAMKITPRVALTAMSFALLPSLLPGTPLFAFVHERLLQTTSVGRQLRVLQSEMELAPIEETLYWHTAVHADPAHKWLRERLTILAANL
jgi:LysR family transcriptional regulator, nod-box dependent transcriptional activator